MLILIFVLPLKRGAKIDIAGELGCIGIAKSFMLYFAHVGLFSAVICCQVADSGTL